MPFTVWMQVSNVHFDLQFFSQKHKNDPSEKPLKERIQVIGLAINTC